MQVLLSTNNCDVGQQLVLGKKSLPNLALASRFQILPYFKLEKPRMDGKGQACTPALSIPHLYNTGLIMHATATAPAHSTQTSENLLSSQLSVLTKFGTDPARTNASFYCGSVSVHPMTFLIFSLSSRLRDSKVWRIRSCPISVLRQCGDLEWRDDQVRLCLPPSNLCLSIRHVCEIMSFCHTTV